MLIPMPSGWHSLRPGVFALPGALTLSRPERWGHCARLFAERMHALTPIKVKLVDGENAHIRLSEVAPDAEHAHHYELTVAPDGIAVNASDDEGATAALASLFQLLYGVKARREMPCQHLVDWPKYAHRGLLLDTARMFLPVARIEKLIEQMALSKMNVLHWHLADDQAWRLDSAAYPKLTAGLNKERYSRDDVRRVCAYAAARGVEVVPEIPMPGHAIAALNAYPALSCSGKAVAPPKTPGPFPAILCAGKDEVYTFLDRIIDEVCALFPGPRVHIGGAEAPKTEWTKCPNCQQKMQALGLTGVDQLTGHMLNHAADRLKAAGKAAICFGDALKAPNLAPDIAFVYTGESGLGTGNAMPEIEKGRPVIFSPARPFDLGVPYCVTGIKDVYDYAPNVDGQAPGEGARVLGLECALWTAYMEDGAEVGHLLFPRMLAVAENGWTDNDERDCEDFLRRLTAYEKIVRDGQINAASQDEAAPRGFARWLAGARFARQAARRRIENNRAINQMKEQ